MPGFTQTKMPAHWASYLINGDASGLTLEERSQCNAYLKAQGIADVIGCDEEAHFSWSFSLYGGDAEGGDLLNYTVRYV